MLPDKIMLQYVESPDTQDIELSVYHFCAVMMYTYTMRVSST
jgi:hypothetical protein